jgi:SAM-dependent methyltransferase
MTNRNEIFSEIYKKSFWGGNGSPSSGTGSTATAATTYRNTVKELISKKKIKKVLDLGHGDWEIWSDYKFEGVDYLGIDVANSISESLSKKYKQENLTFIFGDAVTDNLPKADLCITKDVLQHLPLEDAIKILTKIEKFDHVIICNDFYKFRFRDSISSLRRFMSIRERLKCLMSRKSPIFLKLKKTNSEIKPGDHRCINLSKHPFDSYISSFEIQTIDFIGKDKKRPNVVKRIYLLEKRQ